MKCPKCGQESEFYWSLETNEKGWGACGRCGKRPGEPEGFCPQIDRECIGNKVTAILMGLDALNFVYISNGEQGEHIERAVVGECRALGKFDQYTIIELIMKNLTSHGDYWKKVSDGILTGADPRKRCHCGKLSTCSRGSEEFCNEHWPRLA